jgi:hypothetical protein
VVLWANKIEWLMNKEMALAIAQASSTVCRKLLQASLVRALAAAQKNGSIDSPIEVDHPLVSPWSVS